MYQKFRHFHLIYFGLIISACASAPPKKVIETPKLWSDYITPIEVSNHSSLAPKKTKTHHEFWTESIEGFSLDRLESTLAESGVLAESYGSDGKYEITVGPGTCHSQWYPIDAQLKILKEKRVSQCLNQTVPELKALKTSKSIVKISCEGLSGGGLIDLHNMVVSIAKALVSPQAQEGEKIIKRYSTPTWFNVEQGRCGQIQKLNQYFSKDHLRFQEYKISDGQWALATQGLKAFGLNEISLIFLSSERLSIAKDRLLAVADFAIRVEGLQKGQVITSGVAKGIYVPMTQIQKEYPSLQQIPQALSETMTIIDPNAAVKDIKAFKKFIRKFTVR